MSKLIAANRMEPCAQILSQHVLAEGAEICNLDTQRGTKYLGEPLLSRRNIAQNLPSAGIEVGQQDANERSSTPTTQIADEVLTCWLSMK